MGRTSEEIYFAYGPMTPEQRETLYYLTGHAGDNGYNDGQMGRPMPKCFKGNVMLESDWRDGAKAGRASRKAKA